MVVFYSSPGLPRGLSLGSMTVFVGCMAPPPTIGCWFTPSYCSIPHCWPEPLRITQLSTQCLQTFCRPFAPVLSGETPFFWWVFTMVPPWFPSGNQACPAGNFPVEFGNVPACHVGSLPGYIYIYLQSNVQIVSMYLDSSFYPYPDNLDANPSTSYLYYNHCIGITLHNIFHNRIYQDSNHDIRRCPYVNQ